MQECLKHRVLLPLRYAAASTSNCLVELSAVSSGSRDRWWPEFCDRFPGSWVALARTLYLQQYKGKRRVSHFERTPWCRNKFIHTRFAACFFLPALRWTHWSRMCALMTLQWIWPASSTSNLLVSEQLLCSEIILQNSWHFGRNLLHNISAYVDVIHSWIITLRVLEDFTMI